MGIYDSKSDRPTMPFNDVEVYEDTGLWRVSGDNNRSCDNNRDMAIGLIHNNLPIHIEYRKLGCRPIPPGSQTEVCPQFVRDQLVMKEVTH